MEPKNVGEQPEHGNAQEKGRVVECQKRCVSSEAVASRQPAGEDPVLAAKEVRGRGDLGRGDGRNQIEDTDLNEERKGELVDEQAAETNESELERRFGPFSG